ncbi:helicase [Streptomyces sp. NPDC057705]
MWVSNTKPRRDELNQTQVTAPADLGIDWA